MFQKGWNHQPDVFLRFSIVDHPFSSTPILGNPIWPIYLSIYSNPINGWEGTCAVTVFTDIYESNGVEETQVDFP